MLHSFDTCRHVYNEFLTSASTDQSATTNKEKEQRGGETQNDVAVIAGLLFMWHLMIENVSQLFFICHCRHLISALIISSGLLELMYINLSNLIFYF